MPDQVAVTAFAELLNSRQPLLDVRAPSEFLRGAFPGAQNIPLLDDHERKAVGICYKKAGQKAAIALGQKLVSGEKKQLRLQQWKKFAAENPEASLYCFRGGLRSKTVQQWLSDEGINISIIEGGYKALRRFCIATIEKFSSIDNFIVIGGKTGSAKTHLINEIDFAIDLEGRANHRGSAFGRRIQTQPNQIDFENQLAVDFLRQEFKLANKIFIEDESRAIGSLSVPSTLHERMRHSPIAIIEESFPSRVNTILNDYIFSNFNDFKHKQAASAEKEFADFLLGALSRIRRRLGDEAYSAIHDIMKNALTAQDAEESASLHRAWIENLLKLYYDPMYEYQLAKKSHRIVFRGSKTEFHQWAKSINHPKQQ